MSFTETLQSITGKLLADCTDQELYLALLELVRQKSADRVQPVTGRKLYYISAEFLIGKLLSNNLINLGLYDDTRAALADQELGADVVQLAAGHGLHAGGALLTHDVQQGEVDLLVGAGSQRLGGLGFDSSGHIHNGYLPIIYFLLRFAGMLMVYHKSALDSCAIGANCGTILS